MNKDKSHVSSSDAANRRHHSLKQLRANVTKPVFPPSEESFMRLLHELEVQKIELELRVKERSAELLRVNAELKKKIESHKKREAKLRNSEERLRDLSASLITIREEVQKSIARDIHEELGQLLATLHLQVSMLPGKFCYQEPIVKWSEETNLLVGEAIRIVQRISSQLRPPMLEELGLADAMEWQAREFQERSGIPCRIIVLLRDKVSPQDVSLAVYRIFQEALTNIMRHSGATRVEAYLVEKNRRFLLVINDNGRGITLAQKSAPDSLGLIGMRERAEMLDGRIRIVNRPGRGTAIFARIPAASMEECRGLREKNHHRG